MKKFQELFNINNGEIIAEREWNKVVQSPIFLKPVFKDRIWGVFRKLNLSQLLIKM
ncbi:hypothetical protein [Ureibacillus sp. FSL W8-0352]|uniref:hypothetical protein n=1 Tax=Ureibacillus sp. FSL W8-0352 TaxID=2954596 RepID=UPI0030FD15F6